MSLQRIAIRSHLASMLKTAIPECQGRVYPSRAAPLDDTKLPAICIYTRSERVELFASAPKVYRRYARVQIEIFARGDETVDDVLDTLAHKVEMAIFSNPMLKVKIGANVEEGAADSTLVESTLDISAEGNSPIGVCGVTWDIEYYEDAPNDLTAELPELDIVDVGIDLAAPDGKLEATDTIILNP